MATSKDSTKKIATSIYQQAAEKPVETVRALVADADAALSGRTPVWDRYRKKYRRGLTYLVNDMSSKGVVYFTNYIFGNVETMKATLTKNLPLITVKPVGEQDDIASDVMTRVMTSVMEKGELKKATKGMVHNGLISTLGYIKTHFSPEENKVVFESVLPENMLVDPLASTLKDTRYVVQRRPSVSVEEIYATFGVVAEPVRKKKDLEIASLYDDTDAQGDNSYFNSDTTKSMVGEVFDVYEAWIRCWDEDRENDWYVVTIAGETTLKEEFSVYEHNQLPYDVWFCIEDESADDYYTRGAGTVEEIEPLQDRADAMDIKIMKHLTLMTNRQRYISAQAGLNANTIDNTAGRIYIVNGDPSKTVYYDVPPALNQEIYNYRSDVEPAMQTVSGIFDVMQGRRPTGITAGRAISELKDSAETRTSNMSESVGATLKGVATKGLSIVLQFYDDEMLLKATDADEGEMYRVAADYPEELQNIGTPEVGEDGQFLVGEDGGFVYAEPEDAEEIDPELEAAREQWKLENNIALILSEVDYEWDVAIDTDSALPVVKSERGQIAADMFRLGAIDRQALLDTLDFPNRRKILARLEAEVTGKNAGDPNAEAGAGAIDAMMMQLEQILTQSGAPPEVIEQIMMQMMTAGQDPAMSDAQTGQGNFPPQVV